MFDSLTIARQLTAAGIERGQADARWPMPFARPPNTASTSRRSAWTPHCQVLKHV